MSLQDKIRDYIQEGLAADETDSQIRNGAVSEFQDHKGSWETYFDKLLPKLRDAYENTDTNADAPSPPRNRHAGANKPNQARPRQARKKEAQPLDENLCTAPYRFVPLNQEIVEPEEEIRTSWCHGTLHSKPLEGGFSGSISYQLTFNGPVLVGGNPQTEPAKIGDRYTIPGPTIRGCVRSVLEIASFAKLTQTNLEKRYGLRDFDHPILFGDNRTVPKAGWLRKTGTERNPVYTITPCRHALIKIRDLPGYDSAANHHRWLRKELPERYGAFQMVNSGIYDFETSSKYYHISEKTRTNPATGNRFTQTIAKPAISNETGEAGILVFSDKAAALSGAGLPQQENKELKHLRRKLRDLRRRREKSKKTQFQIDKLEKEIGQLEIKALEIQHDRGNIPGSTKRREVVFLQETGAAFILSDIDWRTFEEVNSKQIANEIRPQGTWAILKETVQKGKPVPVFYTLDPSGKVHDFGLTLLYKRWHLNNTREVLKRTAGGKHLISKDWFPKGSNKWRPDFAEALLGYVHEVKADDDVLSHASTHDLRHLKGRVSFSFAYPDDPEDARETRSVEAVQLAPKPSFSPFYLANAIGAPDWSNKHSELAGYKRYPVRNASFDQVESWLKKNPENGTDNIASNLTFLESKSKCKSLTFYGSIRVHNVTLIELGALLWSMSLGGSATQWHSLGRAKTAGAGQCQFERIDLSKIKQNKGQTTPTLENALRAFTSFMENELKGEWRNSETIKGLLNVTNPTWGKDLDDKDKLAYLELTKHRDARNKKVGKGARALGAV